MAILTGSVALSASISLGKVSITLAGASIGAHPVGEPPISSESSKVSSISGLDGRLAVGGATAQSASASLASQGQIVKYILGASAISASASMTGVGRLEASGKTKGHQGIEIIATLSPSGRLTTVRGSVNLSARAGMFEAVIAATSMQASATASTNADVTAFQMGAVSFSATGTLATRTGRIRTAKVAMSASTTSAVKAGVIIGLPFGSLYPTGLGLFVGGGIENDTTLYISGPLPTSFDTAMPEDGEQPHRPSPSLFIHGKGATKDNSATLFLKNAVPIEGSPSSEFVLHTKGHEGLSDFGSTTLFLQNAWETVETGFRGRLPEFPLFLKSSEAIVDPASMNLFIGSAKTPVTDITLYIASPGSISETPTLYINGLTYTNPDMTLYVRGPANPDTSNIKLSIQGY